MEQKAALSAGVMLNAYPDSMGGTMAQIVDLLRQPKFKQVFDAFYILPSVFNTDLDRGFSVIDYNLNECYATQQDLDALGQLGIDMKFDLILNHASVLSPQFQDLLKNGENSPYKDFFIDWNKFWQGHGQMTPEGYIQPDEELIREMFFRTKGMRVVNMLGCHDGIPVLDLKGLLPEERIEALVETLKGRGGLVKDLHGAKNMYYQVNCTYYSALGESDRRMLMARALQLFMPGKPQVWYLDLFAGRNDLEAVRRSGGAGHKEINRTNLTLEQAKDGLNQPVVRRQLELLHLRNTCPAFGWDAKFTVEQPAAHQITMRWEKDGHNATLTMDLKAESFTIAVGENGTSQVVFQEG